MQRERRHDPYPWTWEPVAAVATAVAALLVMGVQLGRSAANLLAGAGWTWPSAGQRHPAVGEGSPVGTAFWRSLPDVLRGDAGAGLPGHEAGDLAGPELVWLCVSGLELVIIGLCLLVGRWIWRNWGPSRLRGVASIAETEAILGLARIRRTASIVRPDLYSRR